MMRALLLVLGGCMSATSIEEYPCPPAGTQLTYESFGRGFFAANCNSCHTNASAGAPASFRFDTLDDIRLHREHIFMRAAASNTTMPPGPVDPPAADRDMLAEWLACGAP